MPIYQFYCDCGHNEERVVESNFIPSCPKCNIPLRKSVGANIMVKIKGEGGYPSRRKQVFNTTKKNHPSLEKERNKKYY